MNDDGSVDSGTVDSIPPRRPDGFVERRAMRDEVIAALRTPPGRVVLRGLGGSGKTWLALDIANYLAEQRRAAQVVWALGRDHPLSLNDLLGRIVRTLGPSADAALPTEELFAAALDLLIERPALIVIDNFETLAADEQRNVLIALAPSESDTRVLITTRHTGFLAFPDIGAEDWCVVPLGGMDGDQTRALLRSEADKSGPLFLMSAPPSVVEQVRQVTGGLPAAIRWAVAQSRRKPLDELLASIANSPEGPGPALIRGSYGLLQPDALSILRAVCVLEGPVSLTALAAIAGITYVAAQAALREVDDLGLIEERGQTSGGEALLGVHPLVRQFVRDALYAEPDLYRLFMGRAMAHYIQFVRDNGRFQDTAGHRRIADHLETILGLAEYAYRERDWGSVRDLIRPLNNVFWMRGLLRERVKYGRMAREAAAQLKDPFSEGQILSGDLGWTFLQLGDLDDAYTCLSGAIPLLEQTGDSEELSSAWRYLAQLARVRGQLDDCFVYLQRAVDAAQRVDAGSRAYTEARVRLDLGYLALERGRLAEAEGAFTWAAAVFENVGDDVRRSIALNGLGDVAATNNDVTAARAFYEASLELARRRQSIADEGRALLRLARIALKSGDRLAARSTPCRLPRSSGALACYLSQLGSMN
jgi:tetratricopeptide (TPR) repeat protein